MTTPSEQCFYCQNGCFFTGDKCGCSCHQITTTPMTPSEQKKPEWKEKIQSVIGQNCEPFVTKTSLHPNCEYVLSCGQIEKLEKDITASVSSILSHHEQEVRAECIESIKLWRPVFYRSKVEDEDIKELDSLLRNKTN